MEDGGRRLPPAGAHLSAATVEDHVRRLPPGPLSAAHYRVPELEIFSDWDIACHYAPFDHLEPAASVVLVGLNPGVEQALAAYAAARDALWEGASWADAQRLAKQAAGFRGPALTNLVRMLDAIELPRRLAEAGVCRVASSRELFAAGRPEVHATHCVRYPVAVNGLDYGGRRPLLLRSAPLRRFVFDVLGPELGLLSEAVVVPLGRVAAEALAALVDAGSVPVRRCLFGLPHPSGANGHREEDFGRAREALAQRLGALFAGRARAAGPASLQSP